MGLDRGRQLSQQRELAGESLSHRRVIAGQTPHRPSTKATTGAMASCQFCFTARPDDFRGVKSCFPSSSQWTLIRCDPDTDAHPSVNARPIRQVGRGRWLRPVFSRCSTRNCSGLSVGGTGSPRHTSARTPASSATRLPASREVSSFPRAETCFASSADRLSVCRFPLLAMRRQDKSGNTPVAGWRMDTFIGASTLNISKGVH